MPDLLASASLLPLTPAIPSRAPVAAPAAADFMAMLGELVLPPGAKPAGGKGQALAGDGKDLPVTREDSDHGEDETDPAIAWLPAGLVPLQPIEPQPLPDTAPVALLVTASKGVVAAPPEGAASSPEAVRALPQIRAGADVAPIAATPITIAEPVPSGPVPVESAIAPTAEGGAAQVDLPPIAVEDDFGMNMEAAAREPRARPASAPLPTPQPVVQGMAAAPTAGQVFAAAISASFDSPLAPAPRTADAPVIQNQAAAAEQLRTTVQVMSGVERAPLDLSRDDWTGKMVDRIAALRDAAEAADTRIRLAPENLGAVDVSIRRDGERLHVHFAAENAATRQLLAEAAPRLAELADARGVKLGQTSVDAGTGGQQEAPGRRQPDQPMRPASAAARAEADHGDRIA